MKIKTAWHIFYKYTWPNSSLVQHTHVWLWSSSSAPQVANISNKWYPRDPTWRPTGQQDSVQGIRLYLQSHELPRSLMLPKTQNLFQFQKLCNYKSYLRSSSFSLKDKSNRLSWSSLAIKHRLDTLDNRTTRICIYFFSTSFLCTASAAGPTTVWSVSTNRPVCWTREWQAGMTGGRHLSLPAFKSSVLTFIHNFSPALFYISHIRKFIVHLRRVNMDRKSRLWRWQARSPEQGTRPLEGSL